MLAGEQWLGRAFGGEGVVRAVEVAWVGGAGGLGEPRDALEPQAESMPVDERDGVQRHERVMDTSLVNFLRTCSQEIGNGKSIVSGSQGAGDFILANASSATSRAMAWLTMGSG